MIEFKKIQVHSPEWFNFRISQGLGASEISTVLGLNPYRSSLSLFHEKIGLVKNNVKNLRMWIGLKSEPINHELFEYWDEKEEVFLKNLETDNKVRKLEEVGAYCTNSDLQNVFSSLDRRFKDKNGDWVLVEFKNKTTQSYKQFENDINPNDLIQLSTQLLTSTYKLGYIVYLIDNSRYQVFKMTYQESLAMKPTIINGVKPFWKKVEKARIIMNQIHDAKTNYNMALVAQKEMELLQCEPEVDNDMAYVEYLSERAKLRRESVPLRGEDADLKKAKELKSLEAKKKKIETQQAKLKAELLHTLRVNDKTEISFGKEGGISFNNGRFINKIK